MSQANLSQHLLRLAAECCSSIWFAQPWLIAWCLLALALILVPSRLTLPSLNTPITLAVWSAPMARLATSFILIYQGALTIAGVNRKLDEYQHYYNHYRPHDSIGLETPMQYYRQLMQVA